MKATYYIHSNHKQLLGAIVAKYSVEKTTQNADKFDVQIIELSDYPQLHKKHGRPFLREGHWPKWNNEDLQSFTPLRYLPPELMGFEGRSIVVDPDVFAFTDVWELFERDMQGKAIVTRRIFPNKGRKPYWASSVMLLDNAKLSHWNWSKNIKAMFDGTLDYRDWISLDTEDAETIGDLEEEWNAFDTLNETTKLLHNTARTTQPWKAGLPLDFFPKRPQPAPPKVMGVIPKPKYDAMMARLKGEVYAPHGFYVEHPDEAQIAYFYSMVAECLDLGIVTERMIRSEMRHNHVRHDSLELVERYRGARYRELTSVAAE